MYAACGGSLPVVQALLHDGRCGIDEVSTLSSPLAHPGISLGGEGVSTIQLDIRGWIYREGRVKAEPSLEGRRGLRGGPNLKEIEDEGAGRLEGSRCV